MKQEQPTLMKLIKRYSLFLITLALTFLLIAFNKGLGFNALKISGNSIKEMASFIPPIFILLGLLDVWVPRETMVKFMGEGSGLKGIILSVVLGSAAAGPLYGAFPIAAVFMRKGVKFSNILIFIGAWSTTKIPMFLFEMSALGTKFAVTRLLIDIPGIMILAYILSAFLTKQEIKQIHQRTASL